MEKYAYYKSKIGIIKITYGMKIKRIELVDKLGESEPSKLSDRAFVEISQYLENKRDNFDIVSDIELKGSDFRIKVWKALLDVPYGETRTYKDIALAIESPKASRAVGAAIGANPFMIIVPCHRVIRSDGKIGGYEYGSHLKKLLLEMEKGK